MHAKDQTDLTNPPSAASSFIFPTNLLHHRSKNVKIIGCRSKQQQQQRASAANRALYVRRGFCRIFGQYGLKICFSVFTLTTPLSVHRSTRNTVMDEIANSPYPAAARYYYPLGKLGWNTDCAAPCCCVFVCVCDGFSDRFRDRTKPDHPQTSAGYSCEMVVIFCCFFFNSTPRLVAIVLIPLLVRCFSWCKRAVWMGCGRNPWFDTRYFGRFRQSARGHQLTPGYGMEEKPKDENSFAG